MILVTLGTQDKDFSRLLQVIEREIKKGTIQEKVIVQAGNTKYTSDVMEIYDFVSVKQLEQWTKKANLIITHGGVGSIITALKYQKKIIAAPRLQKFHEHTNDHQIQIIKEFAKEGYLLPLLDFNSLGKLIKKSQRFQPKPFQSHNKEFVAFIDDTIKQWEIDGTLKKGKKFREVILYIIFGGLTTFINIFIYFLMARLFRINYQISNVGAWIISVLFAFITNKLFVFESVNDSKKDDFKEMSSFFFFRILSLGFDICAMYFMVQVFKIDDMIAKVISNILVIIINYIFSKLFVFKKRVS